FRFAIIFTLGGGYSPPCRLAFPSVFFIILFYENNFQKTFALLIGTFNTYSQLLMFSNKVDFSLFFCTFAG
ncbi:MAG: hypothetical protein IJM66_02055, partial [Muribaculaceae bacterium]|nr:hypothetical protein [Muribaculaceae bacterium]